MKLNFDKGASALNSPSVSRLHQLLLRRGHTDNQGDG